MPELEMFPKAHIVTFKYYVGVISFLEENYKQVISHTSWSAFNCPFTNLRQKTISLKLTIYASHPPIITKSTSLLKQLPILPCLYHVTSPIPALFDFPLESASNDTKIDLNLPHPHPSPNNALPPVRRPPRSLPPSLLPVHTTNPRYPSRLAPRLRHRPRSWGARVC